MNLEFFSKRNSFNFQYVEILQIPRYLPETCIYRLLKLTIRHVVISMTLPDKASVSLIYRMCN